MAHQAEPRLHLDWRLEVEAADAAALRDALAPESEGHHELRVEDGRLVAAGHGNTAGEALHTLDDLLACLTAALDVIGQDPDR